MTLGKIAIVSIFWYSNKVRQLSSRINQIPCIIPLKSQRLHNSSQIVVIPSVRDNVLKISVV
ncbi:ORF922 [White spot syndrome virus]|uniref:ORF922 n=1 Tax=White spot syndrome virus TaxID=342409 RepID=A0A2D3I733_9VIRU|nr:ORF922 [White spot syndrome virus]